MDAEVKVMVKSDDHVYDKRFRIPKQTEQEIVNNYTAVHKNTQWPRRTFRNRNLSNSFQI